MHGSGKTKMQGRIYCYIKTELDLFALSKGQCKDFSLSINHLFRDAVSRKTATTTKKNVLLLSLSTKESQEAGIVKLIKTPNLLLALFPVLPKGYRCSKAVPCQLRCTSMLSGHDSCYMQRASSMHGIMQEPANWLGSSQRPRRGQMPVFFLCQRDITLLACGESLVHRFSGQ